MKILLAVDGSAYSDAAIEEVAHRPWPPHSEVKVITAAEAPVIVGMEPWAAPPEYFEHLEKSVRDAAKAVIESTLLKLKSIEDRTLKISSEIIQGSPRQVIVEEAERWNADLVVMGSRGLAPGIDFYWARFRIAWSIMRTVPSKSCGSHKRRNARSNRS